MRVEPRVDPIEPGIVPIELCLDPVDRRVRKRCSAV
jgi:hypothetical protein